MTERDPSVTSARLLDLWPVFTWIFLFMAGNGIAVTVTPVLSAIGHFPNWLTGGLGSLYFGGMFLGYFIGPPLVQRFGYRNAALVLLPVMTAGSVVLLTGSPLIWALGRCAAGAGVGICFVIAESWVAARAAASIRMTALSVYIACTLAGMVVSQGILTLIDPTSAWAIFVAIGLMGLAAFQILRAPVPALAPISKETRHGRTLRILRGAPVSIAGVFVSGFAFSTFFTFYPLYGLKAGLDQTDVPMIGLVVTLAATLLQPVLGHFSEGVRTRQLLTILCVCTVGASAVLSVAALHGWALYAVIALWGAGALTTYPLFSGMAYATLKDEPTFDIARLVLMSYGTAEIIGPSLVARLIDAIGPAGLFVMMGGLTVLVFVWLLAGQSISRKMARRLL